MAAAIENAAVVLVCVSKAYKESPNCRLEANYAMQRRTPTVVPAGYGYPLPVPVPGPVSESGSGACA